IKIIEDENLHQYDLISPKDLAAEKKDKNNHSNPEPNKPASMPTLPKAETYMQHIQSRTAPNGRPIYINNDVEYVVADAGENLYTIAQQFGIYAYQLFKYNDVSQKDNIKIGDIVYLQPKKKKSTKATYQVAAGETLRDVSQKTGVKIKSLCKYNLIDSKASLSEGTTLFLQKQNN
ncbi:MAG: LysM peptidoglycan-binding domain-containing protein, partial [Bacteroidales bacterium]|nr:LysM peptidoglycan-binding domain-containing protein [Bacteroidales bacterium]